MNRKRFASKSISQDEKIKDFKGTVKRIMKMMSKYKFLLIIVIFFAISSTIFSIVGPKILGNATTEIFNGLIDKITGGSGINFNKIGSILLFLLFLYLISLVFSIIQEFIITNISQKFAYDLRKKLSSKIDKLPLSYFDSKNHGEVLSVITNDIDTLSQSLNQASTQLITSTVTIIGVLVMMLSINLIMTLIAILMLPITSLIMVNIIKKSQKHFKNQQDYLAKANGSIEEMFTGHSVIKVFNAEEKFLTNFDSDNNNLCNSSWKSQFLSGLMHPIIVFIGNIGYVIIAIIGSIFAIQGKITVGNIQSFIQYIKNFTHPIGQLAGVANMFQLAIASSERIFEFLDTEEESFIKEKLNTEDILGNVEFKNISFGYTKDNTVINNFNIKIKKGQKVAIVGPTGAGKTTIVKLLMHFYDLTSGQILIDNKNINDFNRSSLRKVFGMVLQDTWLFTGSIMDNLRYGKLDATDDEVKEAAKAAYVHHFIQTLPESYHMQINEEADNISQGQKQLLTIARAILANPKILILDEATSSVDTRTEILIQKAMDNLMQGRTSFIIAHRLSTIKNADLILVIDKGNIIETGNHEELLKKDGFYTNLYNSQFEKL